MIEAPAKPVLRRKVNISFGNRKLPVTTAVFNICSATDCPSRKLGLCQVINAGHRCYALRDEQFYTGPLGYRRRQEKLWDSLSAEEFAHQFLAVVKARRHRTKALRLNEAGDFRNQADVDKASIIAGILSDYRIKVYCYTARSDLDFSGVHSNLVINGSGFKVHGEFRFVKDRSEVPAGYRVCRGSCKTCSRCQRPALTCVLPH